MELKVTYRNGECDVFDEKQVDCSTWTMRGHSSNIIEAIVKGGKGLHKIDHYNAVRLEEIISVRVI